MTSALGYTLALISICGISHKPSSVAVLVYCNSVPAGGLMLLIQDLALSEVAEQTTIQPRHEDHSDQDPHAGKLCFMFSFHAIFVKIVPFMFAFHVLI